MHAFGGEIFTEFNGNADINDLLFDIFGSHGQEMLYLLEPKERVKAPVGHGLYHEIL